MKKNVEQALTPLELSLIVPAFKAVAYISQALTTKIAILDSLQIPYEVIIVQDGPDLDLSQVLRNLPRNLKFRTITLTKNKGKGKAVRTGMLEARGRYIGYMDADNDIDPAILKLAYDTITAENLDLVLPSKRLSGSVVDFPKERKLYGNFYHDLVSFLFGNSFTDTQVGMKLYRREVIDAIINNCRIDGFAFEIEMLVLARQAGFTRYKEIPVEVDLKTKSTIKFSKGIQVLWDTFSFYLRSRNKKAVNGKKEV